MNEEVRVGIRSDRDLVAARCVRCVGRSDRRAWCARARRPERKRPRTRDHMPVSRRHPVVHRVGARGPERAHALASRLLSLFPNHDVGAEEDWPPSSGEATLLVNATPVRDELIVEPVPGQTVVDLTYNPDGTPTALVKAGKERGCKIVEGLDVLVAQGAASFERWTGVPAPVEVMRAAVRSLRA